MGELPTTPNETDYVNTADGTARIQVADNRPDADETTTDLSTNPETWPVWQGNEDIPAAQDRVNRLFDIPSGLEPGDPRRFFAIRERTP